MDARATAGEPKNGRPGGDAQLHWTRGRRIHAAKNPEPLVHCLEQIGQRCDSL